MAQSIFISSSGDLADLRKGLRDDLRHWLDQHGFAHLLKPYIWEDDKQDGRLLSDRQRIQDQLLDPAGYDVPLTICLFGERCGSPLEDDQNPLVGRRFDHWRAKGDGPGLLHPWPRDRQTQDKALARGQYPLTGTVFELLSAHAQPEEVDNLIVACCVKRPIMAETEIENVVLNDRKLHARLTTGRSKMDAALIEDEVYDPQAAALLNLLKDHARRVRFVSSYRNEDDMRREVFASAQEKLRKKLGIASLRNPFKQSLVHWTVEDEKQLPGRVDGIGKALKAMEGRDSFVLLKGRSGCGKSSLMQGGVMRALREKDGSIPVPFRPTELMAGSGRGDALDRLAHLIAGITDVAFNDDGPAAMRPTNYAKRLIAALEHAHIDLVLGLDQFEEIIDELKLEQERTEGMPKTGWWLVIRFLQAFCISPHVRLIGTLESARETSFDDLRLGEAIGLTPITVNVDATDDTVAEIARSGFAQGGLPLDRAAVEAIKSQWRAFERETPNDNASPLPLACLFLHRLYEKFADRAGATPGERLEGAFQQASSHDDDRLLTLEEIGGESAVTFANIIQNLADEAWRATEGTSDFSDPIEMDDNFHILDMFLMPLVTVDHDGQMQLRSIVQDGGSAPMRERSAAFYQRRLLVPVPGEGPERVRPVHQALFDRWSPAQRWLAYRKQQIQTVRQFRDEALLCHRLGRSMHLEEDGSTLRAAVLALNERNLDWQLNDERFLAPDETALRDQALAVFDTAQYPLTVVDGSPACKKYVHLAAAYHRVDLLRRFTTLEPKCLKIEDDNGRNALFHAAWVDGPAVPLLLEQEVPLKTDKSDWNVIAAPIQEGLNDNFDAIITHVDIDEPIYIPYGTRMIHHAARYGNTYVIDHLLSRQATIDIPDKNEGTALHSAARADQVEAFRHLWLHIDLPAPDIWKNTALSTAAIFGSDRVLSCYVKEETDGDRLAHVLLHRNNQKNTPLMLAVRHRQPKALRVLLQQDLGDLGDPSAPEHQGTDGDTLFHLALRIAPFADAPTEEERFRARTVVDILLVDGRLDPNLPNDAGETPFDIAGAFPEARRVLRQDTRVPSDYDAMTPAMRIDDLSSRRSATVLRLLKDAPQALTDEHQSSGSERADDAIRTKRKTPEGAERAKGETGLDILIRLKNYGVLSALTDDPVHWPMLRKEFERLLDIAALKAADQLRDALLRRFDSSDLGADEASALLGSSLDARDFETARALVGRGVDAKLRRNGEGHTVLHQAALSGDEEGFRSVLAIGPFELLLDHWGRRPSDLAAEVQAETFRALELDIHESKDSGASATVPRNINGRPPFLALEGNADARPIDDEEMEVLREEWDQDWGDIDAVDIRVFDLPFHPNVPLVDICPRSASATGRLCFLIQSGLLYRLNGTSPPIHEVNAKEMPDLNQETVLYYLAFFCFFVRSEDGPFLIVDRLENEFLPDLADKRNEVDMVYRPPRVWGRDKKGNWLISALVYYADAVFVADFSVQPSGMIEMLDDSLVAADLSARVDAPLDINLLH